VIDDVGSETILEGATPAHATRTSLTNHIALLSTPASECVSDAGKAHCADLGGQCHTERDGYYITSAIAVSTGLLLLFVYVIPTAKRLQGLLFALPV
jgi:hypothetical protein